MQLNDLDALSSAFSTGDWELSRTVLSRKLSQIEERCLSLAADGTIGEDQLRNELAKIGEFKKKVANASLNQTPTPEPAREIVFPQ